MPYRFVAFRLGMGQWRYNCLLRLFSLRAVLHCLFFVVEIQSYRYIQRRLSDIDGFLQKSSLGSSRRGKKMFKL